MTEIVRPPVEPYIETESNWVIPEGASNPEYTIPDAVLRYVVQRLGLDEPHMIGIDPMCGNGTNLSFVNEVGGNLYGIELEEPTYEVARLALSGIQPSLPPGWLTGWTPEVVHGDCTKVALRNEDGVLLPARYIYASPPFDAIMNGELDDVVVAFDGMLLPRGLLSFILIDSADEAIRHGNAINPAAVTTELFERFDFALLDRIAFRITNPPPGCDDQFTELMFVRRQELETWKKMNAQPLSGASASRFFK